MAGTGHDYEILNPGDLDERISSLENRVSTPEARRWLRSRHFRRFLSGPAFVHQPFDEETAVRIDAYPDPGLRDVLRAKASQGRVRIFSPERSVGTLDDPDHVADYLAWAEGNPETMRPIVHADVLTVSAKARAWTHATWKDARTETALAETTPFLPSRHGRTWVRLDGAGALSEEGRRMAHCVAGQAGMMAACGSVFYSLRGPDGRPLLTVREDSDGPHRTMGEARGFANAVGLPWYADDLVILAEHVGMRPGGVASYLHRFDVEWTSDGRWRIASGALLPLDLPGVQAVRDSRRIVLIGEEGEAVATFSGPDGWMAVEGGRPASVCVDARGTMSRRDREALAMLATRFGDRLFAGLPDFLVRLDDGSWADWMRSPQHSIFRGSDVRTRGRTREIHLDDSGPVASVEDPSVREGFPLASFLRTDVDAGALVRLADVLHAMGCVPSYGRGDGRADLDDNRRALMQAGLDWLPRSRRWIHRPSVEIVAAPRGAGRVVVRSTPWDLEAGGPDATVTISFDGENRVACVRLGLASTGDYARESAACVSWLTRSGMEPSPDMEYEATLLRYVLGRGESVRMPVWNGRVWKSLRVASKSRTLLDHLASPEVPGTTGLATMLATCFSVSGYHAPGDPRPKPDPRIASLSSLRAFGRRIGPFFGSACPDRGTGADGFGLLETADAERTAKRVADVLEERARTRGRSAWLDFAAVAPMAGAAAVHLTPARSERLLRRLGGSRRTGPVRLHSLDIGLPGAARAVDWIVSLAQDGEDREVRAAAMSCLAETLCHEPFRAVENSAFAAFLEAAGPVLVRMRFHSYQRTAALARLAPFAGGERRIEAAASLVSSLESLEREDAARYGRYSAASTTSV